MRRGRLCMGAGWLIFALLVSSPVHAQVPLLGTPGPTSPSPLPPMAGPVAGPLIGSAAPPPGAPIPALGAPIPAPGVTPVPSPVPTPGAPFLPDGTVPHAEKLEPEVGHVSEHPTEEHKEEEEGGFCKGLFFTGEYFLLHARRNDLDYAILSPNQNLLPGGSIQSVDWQTRSAFRFGVGYQMPDTCWQLGLYYMYFHSGDNNRMVTAPPGGAVYSTLSRAGGVDDVSSAFGFTSIDYNVIDLELARPIVLDHFQLRPFFGGRFAWIDQQLGGIYNGGSANALGDFVSSPVYFRGAGLTAGARGFWSCYHALGIYASARGSLLSGQFRNFLTETNNNGATPIVNVHETYYQVVPVAELGLGLAWQTKNMNISIGYQLINWFSMVNSPAFTSSSNIGLFSRRTSDLSLEGLAAQVGFLF